MYQLDGYYVCISGNRPVHTAEELRAVYPWIDVRENLGPYWLKEVLAVDSQTNRPFEMNDMRIGRNVGPDDTWTSMPLDEVVRTVPGALDEYLFVYQDSGGRCLGLEVSRLIHESEWELLSQHCLLLTVPGGQEIANVYVHYVESDAGKDVAFMNYYTGGDFFVQIMEYDTSKPIGDSNGYGNYTCAMKLFSPQEAAELVEQLGLSRLEDYFSSLLRVPEDAGRQR